VAGQKVMGAAVSEVTAFCDYNLKRHSVPPLSSISFVSNKQTTLLTAQLSIMVTSNSQALRAHNQEAAALLDACVLGEDVCNELRQAILARTRTNVCCPCLPLLFHCSSNLPLQFLLPLSFPSLPISFSLPLPLYPPPLPALLPSPLPPHSPDLRTSL
jgi:hypothetical protein